MFKVADFTVPLSMSGKLVWMGTHLCIAMFNSIRNQNLALGKILTMEVDIHVYIAGYLTICNVDLISMFADS